MKVLIVDDEEIIRDLLVETFQDESNEVKSASNGLKAIEAYQQFSPEVVILDIMMPEMDGFEVCEKIRNEYKDDKTKIFLLTGMGGGQVLEKGLAKGANKVLFKPISVKELLKTVDSSR